MTKYNRVNSLIVTEEVGKHIKEFLVEAERDESELIEKRLKEVEYSNIGKDYINAYDLAKFMVESALDFEFRTYYQKEFLDKLNIKYDDDINDKYNYVIGYHLDKMYDVGMRLNQARKERLLKQSK